MPTYQVAKGIRESGIHLSAMIANSCQQGSIEMLAEWEGLTDYLLGSPFSIPDVAHDYVSLIKDLSDDIVLEETLKRTAQRTITLWNEYHDYGYFGEVIEVTRMTDLSSLWSALTNAFKYMGSSINGISNCTDSPAVFGETYGKGYLRALRAVEEVRDPVFEYIRPEKSVDLLDYLHNAFIYTGDIKLAAHVNRVEEEINRNLVFHQQTNGRRDFIYSVYFEDAIADANILTRYQTCRFDQLTGWGQFCKTLLDIESASKPQCGSTDFEDF